MAKFITTTEKDDSTVLINVDDIAAIKDESKYHRDIYLSINDAEGNPVVIKSQHSFAELETLIKNAVEA